MPDQDSSSPAYLPAAYLNSFTDKYNVYQQRYAENPRESDKALIRLIARSVGERLQAGEQLSLLDIGCSTGNLLYHLHNAFPDLQMTGGDLAPGAIATCRADARLSGIQLDVMDLFNLPLDRFDLIIANAVMYYFTAQEYAQAATSISKALKKNGVYFSFEFIHPFEQDLAIREVSRSHPDGINLHFRPYSAVRPVLEECGFVSIQYIPFIIPIDLEKGSRYTDDTSGIEDLNSYTVKTQEGERMLFRGALYQPWCHLVAWKGA